MSDFETPLMRDISKLLLPVSVGIILAFVLLFSLSPLNFMYYSLQWELEQFDHGYTWADKQPNGCFERASGVTYFDEDLQKEVTAISSCSSSALPWEFLVWHIPLIIIAIGFIIEMRIRQHNSIVFILLEKIFDLFIFSERQKQNNVAEDEK